MNEEKSTGKKVIGLIIVIMVIVIAASFLMRYSVGEPSFRQSLDGQANNSQTNNSTSGNSLPAGQTSSLTHRSPDFSLSYPDNLGTSSIKESDGSETIVFNDSNQRHVGFQIYISSYKDTAPINREFVATAFPLLKIENPVEIIFGDNVHGLVFTSNDLSIGKTRELWFAHNGYLYQVTTYAALDSWLAEIFKSWIFAK
jgi:hypothetical protein